MVRIAKYNIEIGAIANGVVDVFRRVGDQGETLKDRLTQSLNFRNITRGLATGLAAAVAGGVATIGAGIAGALTQLDDLGELNTISQRLRALPDEVQAIEFAANSVGSSFEPAVDFITEITKRAAEAENLGGEVREIFDAIGIDPGEFKLQGPLDQLETLRLAIDDLSQADRLLVLDEIAGDVGVQLSGLFDGQAIPNAREFFATIDGGINSLDLAQVTAANRSIGQLRATIAVGFQRLLVQLAPTITAITAGVQTFIQEFLRAENLAPILATVNDLLDILLATVIAVQISAAAMLRTLAGAADFAGLTSIADTLGTVADVSDRAQLAVLAARDAAQNAVLDPIELDFETSQLVVGTGDTIKKSIEDGAQTLEQSAERIREITLPQALVVGTSAAQNAIAQASRRADDSRTNSLRSIDQTLKESLAAQRDADQEVVIETTVNSVITCA